MQLFSHKFGALPVELSQPLISMTLANTYNTDKVDGTKDTDSTENTHNTDDVDSIQTISKELSLWGLAAQHVLPACGQLFPE